VVRVVNVLFGSPTLNFALPTGCTVAQWGQ